MLVAFVAERSDNNATFSLNNGTWLGPIATVFSGSGTNWPHRMYYQVAAGGLSATTTITSSKTGAREFGIIELAGVNSFDTHITANNTSACTGTLTPAAGVDAALISSVFERTDGAYSLTAATGMTPWSTIQRVGANYRLLSSTSGGYTVGSTGANNNSSMIGASFIYTAPPPAGRSQAIVFG
jgi:hypothetical protein